MAKPSNIKTRKSAAIGRRRIPRRSPANAETSNKMPPSAEYGVGYGRPPRWTQFKPKKSGNPKGPAKGNQPQARIDSASDSGEKTCNPIKRWIAQIAAAVAFERIGEKASSGDIKSVNFLLARRTGGTRSHPISSRYQPKLRSTSCAQYFEREEKQTKERNHEAVIAV